MATQVFLIRHGETAWSLSGQHTSRTDLPLTVNGERRATQLRALLTEITFTHVLTSPRERARRTGELAGFGAVMRVEPDLQEWDYGEYEGRTSVEIHAQRPGWNVFQDGCPSGESAEQILQRADRLLVGVRDMDGRVVLFSHGHFLRALAVRWIGLPIMEARHLLLDTGSLSVLGYEDAESRTPAISLWNAGRTTTTAQRQG